MCKLFFDLHLLFVCSHSVHQEARTAGQSKQSFQSFPENYKSEGVGSLVNATAIHPRILQTTHKVEITFSLSVKDFSSYRTPALLLIKMQTGHFRNYGKGSEVWIVNL